MRAYSIGYFIKRGYSEEQRTALVVAPDLLLAVKMAEQKILNEGWIINSSYSLDYQLIVT